MEMKTMKCLNLLLRVFVNKVNTDDILTMPLISFVFIVVNERQCRRSNPILSFHNPVYTTFVCLYINSILLAIKFCINILNKILFNIYKRNQSFKENCIKK